MELFALHSFRYLQDQKETLLIKTLKVQMRIVHKKQWKKDLRANNLMFMLPHPCLFPQRSEKRWQYKKKLF